MHFSRVFIIASLFISTAISPSSETKIKAEKTDSKKAQLIFTEVSKAYNTFKKRESLRETLVSGKKNESTEEALVNIGHFDDRGSYLTYGIDEDLPIMHTYEYQEHTFDKKDNSKIAIKYKTQGVYNNTTSQVSYLWSIGDTIYPTKQPIFYEKKELSEKFSIDASNDWIATAKKDKYSQPFYIVKKNDLNAALALPDKESCCEKCESKFNSCIETAYHWLSNVWTSCTSNTCCQSIGKCCKFSGKVCFCCCAVLIAPPTVNPWPND